MTEIRYISLFRNGSNQAIRIPRDLELPGTEAVIRKEGQRLIIEPAPARTLRDLLPMLEPLDEDFATIEDMQAEPVDL